MALIQCPECSNMVSSTADACPQCGVPIARLAAQRIRRKIASVALAVALVFAVVGAIVHGIRASQDEAKALDSLIESHDQANREMARQIDNIRTLADQKKVFYTALNECEWASKAYLDALSKGASPKKIAALKKQYERTKEQVQSARNAAAF